MKFLPAFLCILYVVATQAKSVSRLADPQFVHKYVTSNPRHTAEEWDDIYSNAVADIPDNTTDLILGTIPQSEDAGKLFVKPAERIINGTAAARGQFPWQALLVIDSRSFGGAILISPEWVLTAAHCVVGYSNFVINLGSTVINSTQPGAISQIVRQVIVHTNYNSTTVLNDIGLLKLASAVTLTNYINVVRLPRQAEASTTFAGSAAVVSGFGRINSENSEVASNLLYADVTIITNTECANTFGTFVQATNICSRGTDEKGPCTGDSGGPLVVRESDERYTLVGIVSFSTLDCAARGEPSVYTRVSKYLTWISSQSGIAIA